MNDSNKKKAEKLRKIFSNYYASDGFYWVDHQSGRSFGIDALYGPSPWDPYVRIFHDEDTFWNGRPDVLKNNFVIRHPLHHSFSIVIQDEFAEKILVFDGLPE